MSRAESTDFSAAHSMDTTWFAVDADGHVAAFDSRESGAVPRAARLEEDAFGLLEELKEALPGSRVLVDPLAMGGYAGDRAHRALEGLARTKKQDVEIAFFLERGAVDLDRFRSKTTTVEPIAALKHDGLLVQGQVDTALLREIHKDGHCVRCASSYLFTAEDPRDDAV